MSFSSFTLWLDFTIYSWIRLDSLSSDTALFSKERGVAGENRVFRAMIQNSNGGLIVNMYDSDDWTTIDFTPGVAGLVVASQTWTLVGYSVHLNDDAVTDTVRIWINDGTTENTVSLSHAHYVDDGTSNGYDAFLGVSRQ